MKAVYLDQPGGPEALVYGDMPEPEVAPGEVMLRVLWQRSEPERYGFAHSGPGGRRAAHNGYGRGRRDSVHQPRRQY